MHIDMKKIYATIIIIIIIFWSIVANAQSVTVVSENKKIETTIQNKDTNSIIIPIHVAKQIIVDLVTLDSLKEEIKLSNTILSLSEKKNIFKDSIIESMSTKNQIYAQQILLYKEKERQYIDYSKSLKSEVKKEKFKRGIFSTVGFIVILASALFISAKS